MELPEILYGVTPVSTIVKLVLAMLCGGILGIEREKKRRPAGFRTYMLVCVGSALVMMTNEYIVNHFGGVDPGRMGAQVVSGIGFLGAGTIIFSGKNKVRGLTTAAGLWAAACVGLAIGIGYYSGAVFGCIIIYVVLSALHFLDDKMTSKSRILHVYVELSSITKFSSFMERMRKEELKVQDIEMNRSTAITDTGVGILMTIITLNKMHPVEVIEFVSKTDGVTYVERV